MTQENEPVTPTDDGSQAAVIKGGSSIILFMFGGMFIFISANSPSLGGWYNFSGFLPLLAASISFLVGLFLGFSGLKSYKHSLPSKIGLGLNLLPVLLFIGLLFLNAFVYK